MALQLTERGSARFLRALQDQIRQAQLLDADGKQIEGWNYAPRDVDPELWEGATYEPGFNWIFVSTDPEARPVIIAGLGWADAAGQVLAMEPLIEPFVVQRTGQTLTVDPVLRLFGVVGQQTVT